MKKCIAIAAITLSMVFSSTVLIANANLKQADPQDLLSSQETISVIDMIYPCEYPWQEPPFCK